MFTISKGDNKIEQKVNNQLKKNGLSFLLTCNKVRIWNVYET